MTEKIQILFFCFFNNVSRKLNKMNLLNKLSLREIIKTQNKTVSTDEYSGSSSSIMQQVANSGGGADTKPQRMRIQ